MAKGNGDKKKILEKIEELLKVRLDIEQQFINLRKRLKDNLDEIWNEHVSLFLLESMDLLDEEITPCYSGIKRAVIDKNKEDLILQARLMKDSCDKLIKAYDDKFHEMAKLNQEEIEEIEEFQEGVSGEDLSEMQ